MKRIGITALAACACVASQTYGGIVVDNDEWALSDPGFSAEGALNGTTYAQNVARFLTGGSGSILIYSDNFGLNGTSLQAALTGAGYSVTEDGNVSTPFTAATLSAYKAVFLGGDSLSTAEINALSSYANHGGGVYIAAGTGTIPGGSSGEAAQWNSFLNPYGLSLASSYNGIIGNVPVVSSSPVLAGVAQLYIVYGNSVSASGSAQVISWDGNQGLIGIWPVPEPTTCISAALALLLPLGASVRRIPRKSRAS